MKRYAIIPERLTPLLSSVVIVAAVLLCCPATGVAGESVDHGAASQGGNGRAQHIYLDPDTGEVIPPPADKQDSKVRKQADEDGQTSRQADTGARAWKTREGVQMLTPDPAAMPEEQAVHCLDGSLRIGHADSGAGHSARQALCARRRND